MGMLAYACPSIPLSRETKGYIQEELGHLTYQHHKLGGGARETSHNRNIIIAIKSPRDIPYSSKFFEGSNFHNFQG